MSSNLKPATVKVGAVNASAVERYREMRSALMEVAEIDPKVCEIAIACQLAALGLETSFKMHAMRLFDLDVSKEQVQHIILSGVGVTLIIGQAATVLDWIEEAHTHYAASHRR